MKHFPLLAVFMTLCASAFAQTAPPQPAAQNSGQPIEITATDTVEWLRNQSQYVARKDVIVKQGTMEIHSDLLTADYRDGATSSMEIWQLTAEGNVQIKDETSTAFGDHGVYDVTKGVAVLTGSNLRLVSPDQTVTAKDRMEYHANERFAKAIGNAVVTRPRDTLKADVLTAYFSDSAAGSAPAKASASPLGGGGNIDRLEAQGHVVIITPTEKLYGNKAIYRAASNTAEITGNVRIERGQNVLQGERAQVDLNTNISKMFGSEKEGGRVRGVFFPGSDKKPGANGTTPPSNPPVNRGTIAPAPAPQPIPPQGGGTEGGVITPPAPETPAVSPTSPPPAAAKVSPRIEY